MPEEAATIEAEPAASTSETNNLRPEALKALDSLSERMFGKGQAQDAPVEPVEPVIPGDSPVPPVQAKPVTPPPAKPVSDVLTVEDLVSPPDSLLDGKTTAPAAGDGLPSVDEVFPEEPPVVIRTDKGKADYRKWRESYKSMEHALKESRAKLKQMSAPEETAQARIAELETRIGEMSQAVERANLIEHPAFQKQFEQPIAELRERAEGIVRDAGIDPNDFARVMAMKGNERIKGLDTLTENMDSPTLRRRLERTVEEMEAKESERAKVLGDVKGNLDRLRNQEKVQRHQALESELKQLNGLVDGLHDHFAINAKIPFFQKGEGPQFEAWNAGVEADKAEARRIVTSSKDQTEIVGAVELGVAFPRVFAAYVKERKARIAAESAIAERRGAEPDLSGAGGGGSGANGAEEDQNDNDMSLDGIRRRLRRGSR